jgi:hypothetical protein
MIIERVNRVKYYVNKDNIAKPIAPMRISDTNFRKLGQNRPVDLSGNDLANTLVQTDSRDLYYVDNKYFPHKLVPTKMTETELKNNNIQMGNGAYEWRTGANILWNSLQEEKEEEKEKEIQPAPPLKAAPTPVEIQPEEENEQTSLNENSIYIQLMQNYYLIAGIILIIAISYLTYKKYT